MGVVSMRVRRCSRQYTVCADAVAIQFKRLTIKSNAPRTFKVSVVMATS